MSATDLRATQAAVRRPPASRRRARGLALSLLVDVVLLNVAFVLGYTVRYQLQLFREVSEPFFAPYSAYVSTQLSYTVLMVLFLAVDGLYQQRREGSWSDEVYRIINVTTTVVVILIAGTFMLQLLVYSRLLLIEVGVITIGLLSGARLARRGLGAYLRRRGVGVDRVLIVGAGEIGRAVMRNLVARPELGYQVVGFIDDDLSRGDLGRFRALGALDNIMAVLKSERLDEVIITLPWTYHRTIMGLVRSCESLGVRARVVPDLFQLSLSRVDFDDMGGIPLVGLKETSIPRAGRVLKRALDIVLSIIALLVTAPLLILVAILIRLDSPGPALFSQRRVGEDGRLFNMYKFRSMRMGAEEQLDELQDLNQRSGPVFKIKADPRVTRMGRWLRRLSIDELPQFFNVLRGEMSIVGPRPALPPEVAKYEAWHRQRLEVPPGISGLWQVSGRSELSFDEMCMLDVYYIENWSLGLDLAIMLKTVPRVLFADGAY